MGHPVANKPNALPDKVNVELSNGEKLVIRGASRVDIPALAEIYCRAYEVNGADEHWTPESAARLLSKLSSDYPGLSLVAEIEGKVVGATFGNIRPWESGKVILEGKELFVDPEWQKHGIATELLKERLHRAEVWGGANEVEFITFTDESGPQGFHERSGLKPIPELQIMAGSVKDVKEGLEKRSLNRGGLEK